MDNKLSKLAGNPYGTYSKEELTRKMDYMKKAELITFAKKIGVAANQQQIVQEIKENILREFSHDSRAIDILAMPKPKKFDLDFSDPKIQRLFNA